MTRRLLQLSGCISLLLVFAACPHPISQQEFDDLEQKVDAHRTASKAWADVIHVKVMQLQDCYLNPTTCTPPDGIVPPPPGPGW